MQFIISNNFRYIFLIFSSSKRFYLERRFMSDRSIQKFKEYVQKLNPIDDIIFRKMAENKEFCEEILRTFLQDYQLKVLNNKSQYAITNIERRSVILDAYCELRDGRRVNIEVQNADNVNHQKRVRYYSSVLTTSLMKKGESFDNVPEVCMVYICNFDIFKENKSSYLIKRVIDGSNREVDNGLKEIYISANINDGTTLSELMGVFTKDDCYSENFPVTSKMKYDFKYVKEGNKMTDAMKELYDIFKEESKDKWIKEGRKEGVINTLLILVKDGIISVEYAAKRANISVGTFQKYLNEKM